MHEELEVCVANFVGKPSALVFGMGYVTNSAILPVLIGKVNGYTLIKNLLLHVQQEVLENLTICSTAGRANY